MPGLCKDLGPETWVPRSSGAHGLGHMRTGMGKAGKS